MLVIIGEHIDKLYLMFQPHIAPTAIKDIKNNSHKSVLEHINLDNSVL